MRKLFAAIALAAIVGNAHGAHAEFLEPIVVPAASNGAPALVRLNDGRPLIIGGGTATKAATSAAEVFDATTKTWMPIAPLRQARFGHGAVTLPSGKVLVAGGTTGGALVSTAELYDPTTNTWTDVGATAIGRPRATLVSDGRAAFLYPGSPTVLQHFDPVTNTWTSAATPKLAHYDHSLAPLADGGLLLASPAGIERYRPTSGWTVLTGMPDSRQSATALTLPDGRVLVAGGAVGLSMGEPFLFEPATESFRRLAGQRRGPGAAAVLLADGHALIVGGTAAFELFRPAPTSVIALPTTYALTESVAVSLGDGRALIIQEPVGNGYLFTPPKGCSAPSDCTSGFCVDGFCCDKACDGQCEACDVERSIGTCTGVTGAPHGAREQCSPPWTPACRATTCDPSRSRTQCVAPVFAPPCDCTSDGECSSGHCVDGVCCNTACEGQCEACDLPGSRGVCVPVTGEPRGVRKGCPAAGRGICTVQACNGKDTAACSFAHGPETGCDTICGGRVFRHCNGSGLCGLPSEMQCPDTGCSLPSTEPSSPPRFFDAVLVVALGALVERMRRTRR